MVNNGIWLHNNLNCPEHSTIAVTGLGRSGTTMLARILTGLGINMGQNITPQSHEDKDIQLLLKSKDMVGFGEICNARNEKYDQWGFKSPGLRGSLQLACNKMRNPRVIVIFRDVLSISLRNNISMDTDVISALESSIDGYSKLIRTIKNSDTPILALSYEKCLANPTLAIEQIATFCGKKITLNELEELKKLVVNGDPNYLSRT
jgi:hypothetical protein